MSSSTNILKAGVFCALIALWGCGSDGSNVGTDPTNFTEARLAHDAIHAKTLQTISGPSADVLARQEPFPFTASNRFTKVTRVYSFYESIWGSFRYESANGERNQIWNPPTANFSAPFPNVHSDMYIDGTPLSTLVEDGTTLTVSNDQTGDTFSLAGLTKPSGANITYTFDQALFTSDGKNWNQSYSGVATFASGWRAAFTKYSQVENYQLTSGTQTVLTSITFRQPIVSQSTITISGPTSSHTSSNTTLDFDITTVNTTLQGWGVQVEKDNQVIKTLSPTIDPRGPGTGTGTNPLHVSLQWDGKSDNNQVVTGNVTWVMTARTTSYINGGAVNDGINSIQSRLNTSINTGPLPVIETISADHVTLVNVTNAPIKTPQYDVVTGKHEPIAIPLSTNKPRLSVELSLVVPPDAGPLQYSVWAVTDPAHPDKVFAGPVNFVAQRSIRREREKFDVTLPSEITKIPLLFWFSQEKLGVPIPIATTTSPIYVTLDKPQPPQSKPRVDVLDLAVTETSEDHASTEESAMVALVKGIYFRSGFVYSLEDRGQSHHTDQRDVAGDKMDLRVSDWIPYPGNQDPPDILGNCQDFSNLVQVAASALGVKKVQVQRIDGAFRNHRVIPIGIFDWVPEGVLEFHQVVFFKKNPLPMFDPTYQLDAGDPLLPTGLSEDAYKRLLWLTSSPDPGDYSPRKPVAPRSVR